MIESQESFNKLVQQVFQNHYDFHSSIGVDFIKSDSGHINQVSSDYQGRILYELLQNAFDRATDKIIVKVIGKSLFVANDGKRFTYNASHDYKDGGVDGETFVRCDFQSLCSISTSNKTANESIGNKGVGFKSVYALGRYANIHTKGIVNPKTHKQEGNISFRLFDVFDDIDNIPEEFEDSLKGKLIETIKSIQREFPQRGVPGYYFPLQLNTQGIDIFKNFDDNVVTIIEVPFHSEDEVQKLLKEIEDIHFGFVGLKYENRFEIIFETESQTFIQTVNSDDDTLFSAELNSDKIKELAINAGIDIEEPKVAIKFKKTPDGLFYNYLPTKKVSPFKYVDFHADFHTTVDRKDINFDGEKIGAYNRALLQACVELFFSVLNTGNNNLQISHLRNLTNTNNLEWFQWQHLIMDGTNIQIFYVVRNILKIRNWHYEVAASLLSDIAKQFFSIERNTEEHQQFFRATKNFIECFARYHGDVWKWIDYFKVEFIRNVLKQKVQILPQLDLYNETEIIYKEKASENISIPQNLRIYLTHFKVEDKKFKEQLNIKDYNEPNEILKHFKQCSFLDNCSDVAISEAEQQKILESCYQLYLAKNEREYLVTHRYAKLFGKPLKDYSTLNQANFNISTLFLKLKNGKYKPAQLCVKSELDLSFLSFCSEENFDNWLRFLGVSTTNDFRFVDKAIYESLKEGISYLPQLLSKQNHSDKITGELVRNIRIVNRKNTLTHPALVNDNNYSFLTNISSSKIKPELENLYVKNYSHFTKEYLDILRGRLDEHLKTRKSEIIRFYQNIFEVYAKRETCLVVHNNNLEWTDKEDFFVVSNKFDFDLCTKHFSEKRILAYYLGRSDYFESKKIKPTKGEISYSDKVLNSDLKNKLTERIYFILLSLSHSKNSEADYLSEDATLTKLQSKFEHTQIYNCSTLSQELRYENIGSDVSPKAYAYTETELFLSSICTKSQAARGICDYLFGNISIKDQVELILFHKKLYELQDEYDRIEFELIKRKWKPDYQEKFVEFQSKILAPHQLLLQGNELWYKYNKEHINGFLIHLDKSGKLNELERDIVLSKNEFDGYFDSFQLEIDYSHINSDIAVIKTFYDKRELDESQKVRIGNLLDKAKKRVLGLEPEIEKLKSDYPEIFEVARNVSHQRSVNEDLKRVQAIEGIYNKVKLGNIKEVSQQKLDAGNQTSEAIANNHKQIIFQGTSNPSDKNKELEITGASGEVEVLICLINEFVHLPEEAQREGVKAIRDEMRKQTNGNSFDQYADECLKFIGDKEQLSKALIPLFYVAKKYKYAHFDLISFRNGKPTLVEVKTTNNINSRNFYISISEVNTARRYSDYELVRVTPKSIIFMGNPIKELDKSILEVKTNGFRLKPRNYEFILN